MVWWCGTKTIVTAMTSFDADERACLKPYEDACSLGQRKAVGRAAFLSFLGEKIGNLANEI